MLIVDRGSVGYCYSGEGWGGRAQVLEMSWVLPSLSMCVARLGKMEAARHGQCEWKFSGCGC